jgi:ribonuclease I
MNYTFYELAVQNWCSKSVPLIHGLWPDYTHSTYPAFCGGPAFDLDLLKQSPSYDKIAEYWQDCTPDETITLWEHEWSKHGTCVSAQTGFSQNEYFEKAVELYEEYPDGGCFDLDFVWVDCQKY